MSIQLTESVLVVDAITVILGKSQTLWIPPLIYLFFSWGRMNSAETMEDKEEMERVTKLKECVIKVQSSLKSIVMNQKKQLEKDEEYQKRFYKLCNDIGVDPFTQKKGFLSGLLNKNLDEFYKQLGMRVLGVCLDTRYENGGLIKLSEIKERLNSNSDGTKAGHVQSADIRMAVEKLSVLSSSLCIVHIEDEEGGEVEYIKSADMELSGDSLKILAKANRRKGKLQVADMGHDTNGKWKKELDLFVDQGIAWIDVHEGLTTYYFPTIVFASS